MDQLLGVCNNLLELAIKRDAREERDEKRKERAAEIAVEMLKLKKNK